MKIDNRLRMLAMIFLVIGAVIMPFVEAKGAWGNAGEDISDFFTDIMPNFITNTYMLINTFVLAIIFFILQHFIFKGEFKDKNASKYVLWAALIILAGIIAWKFGSISGCNESYVWQHPALVSFFHLKVIVNAAIAALVFYILAMLLAKNYINSKEAKIALGLLVLILAVFVSLPEDSNSDLVSRCSITSDSYQEENYRYWWQRSWWSSSRLYLLGDKNCYAYDGDAEDIPKITTKEESTNTDEGDAALQTKEIIPNGEKNSQEQDQAEQTSKLKGKAQALIGYEKDTYQQGATPTTSNAIFDVTGRAIDTVKEKDAGSKAVDWIKGKSEDKQFRYCYDEISVEAKGKKTQKRVIPKDDAIGFGILKGQQLFVLIGGFLLLLWIFSTTQMDKNVRYILSIALAVISAHDGMGRTGFLWIAYWVSLIKLGGKLGQNKAMSFGLAFAIVELIGNMFGIGFLNGKNFVTLFIYGFLIGGVYTNFNKEGTFLNALKQKSSKAALEQIQKRPKAAVAAGIALATGIASFAVGGPWAVAGVMFALGLVGGGTAFFKKEAFKRFMRWVFKEKEDKSADALDKLFDLYMEEMDKEEQEKDVSKIEKVREDIKKQLEIETLKQLSAKGAYTTILDYFKKEEEKEKKNKNKSSNKQPKEPGVTS